MQGVETRNELILGTSLCCALMGIVGLLLGGGAHFLAGLAVGLAASVGIVFHMHHCIDVAVDLDEKSASKYGRGKAILRMVATAAVIAAAFLYNKYVNPFGVVLGIWAIKPAAYLHVFLHKRVSPGDLAGGSEPAAVIYDDDEEEEE